MASSELYLYFLLETGKTEAEQNPASAPALIRQLVATQRTRFFDGVGTKTSSNLLQRCLYFPIQTLHQFTGFDMKDKILEAWESTKGRQNGDHVILMGCSRGGYSAQILAQIVNHYGYPTDDLESNKDVLVSIRKGLPPGTPANIRNVSLYALDPVGSYGGLTTPVQFLGFHSKRLPPILRARVVLMAGEGRIGFQPNIYANDSSDSSSLQQVWFDGEHGDAWGPSAHFRHVLAYILGDMASNGVTIKEHLLEPVQNPSHRLGFLSRLLHWKRRYSCPLPNNQVRHYSCGRFTSDNESQPTSDETRMVTLLNRYNCLSELTLLC